MAEHRQPRHLRDPQRDLDGPVAAVLHAQPACESARELPPRGRARVSSDGGGARGRSCRRVGRPGGVTGQRELPRARDQERREREQGDELGRRLSVCSPAMRAWVQAPSGR